MVLYLPALTFSPKLLLVLLRAAFPKSIWALTGLFPCACGMEVPRAPMLPADAPWLTPRFRLLALGGRLLYYVTRRRAVMRLTGRREKRGEGDDDEHEVSTGVDDEADGRCD